MWIHFDGVGERNIPSEELLVIWWRFSVRTAWKRFNSTTTPRGYLHAPTATVSSSGTSRPEVEQLDEEDNLLLTVVSGFFSGSLLLTGLALLVASLVGFSFSSILWGAAGEGSTDNLGGIGVVVVMGFAGAGFLLSLAVGFWGLSILLLGLARVLRK